MSGAEWVVPRRRTGREFAMKASPQRRLLAGSAACAALLVAAFVVPRQVGSDAGPAIAREALATCLGLLATASAAGVVVLVYAIRCYGSLSLGARVSGIAPGVILGSGLLLVPTWLAY